MTKRGLEPGTARIAALTYHEITDDPSSTGFQRPYAARYAHRPRAFQAHLEAMAAAGGRPHLVTDSDLTAGGPWLLLTFDDGGRSALDAAELLERRGWRGHFLVVTECIGTRPFLAPDDVRDLVARGHVVGSHSRTHPDIFRDLSRARMLAEWRTSRDELADMLGEPCLVASVPGGDISPTVLATAAEAGYRYLFTSEPWRRPRRVGDCWVLGRVCLKAGTSPATVRALVEGRGWTRAWIERQLKEVARRAFAPLYRSYVRRVTRPAHTCPAPQPHTTCAP